MGSVCDRLGHCVWNWGRILKLMPSGLTVVTWGLPVELPVNWDWDEREWVAGPWEEGEDGGLITTHIIVIGDQRRLGWLQGFPCIVAQPNQKFMFSRNALSPRNNVMCCSGA